MCLDEVVPIHIIQEDVLTLVAPAHDVINRPRIFEADFARHKEEIAWKTQNVKIQ
jgi:hypothetical protein